jgi:hypothetical protein
MYVNAKIIPVETISRRRGIKGEWGGESKYDIFDTFVNAIVYSHPAQQ